MAATSNFHESFHVKRNALNSGVGTGDGHQSATQQHLKPHSRADAELSRADELVSRSQAPTRTPGRSTPKSRASRRTEHRERRSPGLPEGTVTATTGAAADAPSLRPAPGRPAIGLPPRQRTLIPPVIATLPSRVVRASSGGSWDLRATLCRWIRDKPPFLETVAPNGRFDRSLAGAAGRVDRTPCVGFRQPAMGAAPDSSDAAAPTTPATAASATPPIRRIALQAL